MAHHNPVPAQASAPGSSKSADIADSSGTTPEQRIRHHTALRIAGIEGMEVFADLLTDGRDKTPAASEDAPAAPSLRTSGA